MEVWVILVAKAGALVEDAQRKGGLRHGHPLACRLRGVVDSRIVGISPQGRPFCKSDPYKHHYFSTSCQSSFYYSPYGRSFRLWSTDRSSYSSFSYVLQRRRRGHTHDPASDYCCKTTLTPRDTFSGDPRELGCGHLSSHLVTYLVYGIMDRFTSFSLVSGAGHKNIPP